MYRFSLERSSPRLLSHGRVCVWHGSRLESPIDRAERRQQQRAMQRREREASAAAAAFTGAASTGARPGAGETRRGRGNLTAMPMGGLRASPAPHAALLAARALTGPVTWSWNCSKETNDHLRPGHDSGHDSGHGPGDARGRGAAHGGGESWSHRRLTNATRQHIGS